MKGFALASGAPAAWRRIHAADTRRRAGGMACVFAAVVNAVCLVCAVPVLAAPPAVTLREVASGLSKPVEIVNARDGSGRLFVVEQDGRIRVLQNGTVLPTPFLDLSAAGVISTGDERGLLGLAFHPQYAGNGAFYVFYTRVTDGALTIARYLRKTANPNEADPATAAVILTIPHPANQNHNGGRIAFGPEGNLYVATGDGGGSGDQANNAQNLSSLLGKLLRISVDGGAGYTIPPGNPFAGSTCAAGACPEIWAYGLRNPWKFSFDRVSGDLFIGDVGQGNWEEIDFEPAGGAGGRNYGWRVSEGTHCFNPPSGCSFAGHVLPIVEYGHNAQGGRSVTGGYRYRGKRSLPLRGFYIYGDFVSSRVWAAEFNGTWSTSVLIEPGALSNISTFGEDEAGELYVASYGTGRIYAIDGQGPRVETWGDFNADGLSEILWRHSENGQNIVWFMHGATRSGTATLSTVDASWLILGQGDFDADGRADILWRHASTGQMIVWLMDGATRLAAGSPGTVADAEWEVVAVSDFDGNRTADILWRHKSSGHNILWFMNGAARTGTGTLSMVSDANWRVAGAGDFDGDGKADLLWRHAVTGQNALWRMNGAARLSATNLSTVADANWKTVSTADFNGDGKADILWRNVSTGQNILWFMDGTARSGTGTLSTVATTWSIVATGDYNGDGKADILWRSSSGQNVLWLMNGAMRLSATTLSAVADTNWKVVAP